MDMPDASQMFSNPGDEAVVMAAWERFLSGGEAPHSVVRHLVDTSWQRCLDWRVDPTLGHAPPPLDEHLLYSLKRGHRDLVEASAPVMAHARDFLAQTETVMALAEPAGTILNLEGDPAAIASAHGIQLLPGASWNEMICGTNAIGTAIEVGQPVQIHSAEHFCAGIKRWTCSANAIRDPRDGTIIGVIDVSGLSESYNRHSLALVVTAASRIESRLAARTMELRYRLLDRCMRRLAMLASDGAVVFDHGGYPIKVNEHAEAAIAAAGGDFSLARPGRILALAADAAVTRVTSTDLPHWIQPDWIEPVIEDGRRIGSLLIVPFAPRCSATRKVGRASGCGTQGQGGSTAGFERIQGEAPALLEAVDRARQIARSHAPVVLLGETGVGKELFAMGIHHASQAKEGPFIALNCGGLSRELLASELFGYGDGAFTGARRGGALGKIEAANGGTLFLDEIGEMPVDLQPHFLRVLEQGEIYRLGENVPRTVTFRLIAATNRDLRKEVSEGRFRMDFFYRVAVTSIRIPPLRDRPGDVRRLTEYLVRKFAAELGRASPAVDDEVVAALCAYSWPGNVRELRNVVESMLLTAGPEVLTLADLPPDVRASDEPIHAGCEEPFPRDGRGTMEASEQGAIRSAIAISRGNLTSAARHLGIAKSTLYQKLRKYGLDRTLVEIRDQGR
ncbi:sigma-54-dependent Fis family transcriptional regulator [Trinickia mobilis]|uniref:sigma-54-dependent Fis family transcriptional regulator n=1 Tax=Trinickia mobilis TaxID=2816356 RepID=UPI001F5D8AAC|nr:sigma-54-dependent Fis family transcriptional regulator [Trinickia mobilis]